MREGAFALIDCLGFKGIWKRTDPDLLIKKLSKIEQIVHAEIQEGGGSGPFKYLSFGPMKLHVRLLSDTVAISLQYEELEGKTPENWQKNFLVGIICQAVIQVLDLFLKDEPPLVLRGCISYGEHLSEGNFIVGPVVDEAAEYMNIAEGAFVWLLPSAEDRYMRMVARNFAMLYVATPEVIVESWRVIKKRGYEIDAAIDMALDAAEKYGAETAVETWMSIMKPLLTTPIVIAPYDMPLKTGARLRCAILNPLVFQKTQEERRKAIETYSKVIAGNRLDLWLKNQHTLDFLEVADKQCVSFYERLSKLKPGGLLEEEQEQGEPSQS